MTRWLIGALSVAVAVLTLTGCGGGSDRRDSVHDNQLATVSDAQISTIAAQCQDDHSPCATIIATLVRPWRPTPRPDMAELEQRMKALALADPTVQTIIGTKLEGVGYWVDPLPYKFPVNGEDGGLLRILFKMPVSFSGDVLVSTDPCHAVESAQSIENSDPCQKVRREFSTANRTIASRAMFVQVDVLTGRVYNIQDAGMDVSEIDAIITRYMRATATQQATQTLPTQSVQPAR